MGIRAWYRRVRIDLESLGWRVHQLDQCRFLLYDGSELIGTCGVYVDDFIIAGNPKNRKWQDARQKLMNLYKWGKWESGTFTLCGVRYVQKHDGSIVMDQREFTAKLSQAEFNLPKNLHKLNGNNKLDATGLTTLRGLNGSV